MNYPTNPTISNEVFLKLAENLQAILWIAAFKDGWTQLVYINPVYEKIWGRPVQSLLADPESWLETVHPEDRPGLAGLREKFLQGDFPEMEYRIIRPDGEIRWIHTHTFPLLLEPGETLRVGGLSVDVTARRQTGEALKGSEETLRLLYEGIPLGYQSLDAEGRLLEVNQAWLDALGYSREEVISRDLREFLAPGQVQLFDEKFSRFRVAGELNDLELNMVRKDGSFITVSYNGKIDYDFQGRFQRSHCVVANITERKQAEKALRESERNFRLLIANSPIPIAVTDNDANILTLNQKFTELFGYSSEELRRVDDWWPLAYPDDAYRNFIKREWERRIAKAKEKQGEIEPMEAKVTCKNGSERHIRFFYSAMDNVNIVIFTVLSERQQAEAELFREKEKYRLLSEKSPVGVAIIGADGAYKYLNRKFTEIFGYRLEDVPTGKVWFAKAFPEAKYRRQLISLWKKDSEGGKMGEGLARTFTVTCKDGSEKIINFRPVTLETGEHLVIYQDITEAQRAEEALRQSEQKYRLLVSNMPAVVFKGYADWSVDLFDDKIKGFTG
jgi:PAS domain S-box-containing protein